MKNNKLLLTTIIVLLLIVAIIITATGPSIEEKNNHNLEIIEENTNNNIEPPKYILEVEYDKTVKVSINTKVYNTDYIHNIVNGELITEKELLDTSKVGTQNITFIIKDFNSEEQIFSYNITIFDSEAPVIKGSKNLETVEGTKINLLKNITVTDNSKEKITPTIEGKYNFNKAGTYNLAYIAKDSSGNSTRKAFTLTVKAKPVTKPSTSNNNSNNSNNNTSSQTSGSFTTSKGFKGVVKNGITYIDGYMIVNKTYSLPKDYVPTSSYGNPTTTSTTQCANCIDKTTYDNWLKMKEAAAKEGLTLLIVSGYRSYTLQTTLYNRAVQNKGKTYADTSSARPGHSEHQSGLSFDVNQVNDAFANTAEAKWLNDNCYKYGFILRYPNGKTKETGYKYEPWHFRYVGVELATKLYNNGDWITMEEYFGVTSEYQN